MTTNLLPFKMWDIVILLVSVIISVYQTDCIYQTSEPTGVGYNRIPNKALNHVIGSLQSMDVSQCCLKCSVDSRCTAVNFYPNESVCGLNDKNPYDYADFINLVNNLNSDVFYQGQEPCNSGWHLFDRHCYNFVTTPMNWADSQTNCHSMGAYLVEITSSKENLYIFDTSANLGLDIKWIGLNDILVEGSFVWPSGEPFEYHNFNSGGPDNYNGNQHCVGALPNNYWDDVPCHGSHHSVCEKAHY